MSTALVARPAPGALRRIGGLRYSSPGRLQLILATLIGLSLLTGLVAGLTGGSARAGAGDLGGRAQPLLAEAETIYSALADADTTAAQAFLAGGLEPVALTQRYDDDLTRATTALSSAARRTPEGSATAGAVGDLAAGVTRYSALVATARADNRQGLPVGASYLAAASRLNRDTLLVQAQQLYRLAEDEVDDGYSEAASITWVVLFALLSAVLLAALLGAQRYLSRATHRTFNLPLAAATGLTALLALGAAGILIGQNAHLHRAERDGSAPAGRLAEARILALQIRADEALTLVARGSDDSYEQRAAGNLGKLGDTVPPALAPAVKTYADVHKQIRERDDNGDYEGAVDLAIGPATTKAFETVRSGLDDGITDRKAVFAAEVRSAGNGLGLLTVLGPLFALIICALAAAGIRARLEEYR